MWTISRSSGDGNRLATWSSGKLSVWDVKQAREIWWLDPDSLAGYSSNLIALNEDGALVALLMERGVTVWTVGPLPPSSPMLGEGSETLWSLSFRPDGKLQTGSESGELLWEIQAGRLVPQTLPSGPLGVQLSLSGKYQAVTTDGGVKIEGEGLGVGFTISGPLKMHSAVFLSDGRPLLVTGDADGTIRVWDVPAAGSLGEMQIGEPPQVVAVSRDGRLVAAATGLTRSGLEIWERSPPRRRCRVGLQDTGAPILSLAFSPDGLQLATGMDADGSYFPTGMSAKGKDQLSGAMLWKASDCSLVSKCPRYKTGGVSGLDFSPDGQRLAMSGRFVAIWDKGANVQTMVGPGTPTGIAWSKDALQVATEHGLWNLTTRGRRRLEHPGRGPIGARRVAFSPDKQLLATPGPGSTISLWNRSGQPVASLYGHGGLIMGLAFTEDSREVLVITDKWKLYRHPVRVEDLVAEARKRVPEPLDPKDCAQALRLPACPGFLLGQAARQ